MGYQNSVGIGPRNRTPLIDDTVLLPVDTLGIRPRQLLFGDVDPVSGRPSSVAARTPASPMDERPVGMDDGAASAGGIRPRRAAPVMVDAAPPLDVEATRPRRVHEAGSLEAQQDEFTQLQNNLPSDHNGRIKSMLLNMAYEMSRQAQAVSEGAARTGRPVDMYGLASVLGAAGGGFAGGAINPTLDEGRARLRRMDELEQAIGEQLQFQKAEQERTLRAAQVDQTKANAAWLRARPDLEAQKRADAAAARERTAVLANLRLYKGTKLDVNNPTHAALLQRAADAGIEVDAESFNAAGSNLVPVDVVDPATPTQKRRKYYNKATGELSDVGQTGYVAPIHADTEMTSGQEHTDADRDASRAETHRHNEVTEGQGKERIGISRDNSLRRGEPTATNQNARLGKASTLARLLEEEKNRAAHPPYTIQGQPTSDAYRRAYTERHLQAARGYAQQITNAYGDLYEAGDGDGGFPYAKPKVQPNARPQGGARPARPRIRQANIPAAVDDLIKAGRFKDRQAAEKYVRDNMDVIN